MLPRLELRHHGLSGYAAHFVDRARLVPRWINTVTTIDREAPMNKIIQIDSDVTRKQAAELANRLKASDDRVVELAVALLWARKP